MRVIQALVVLPATAVLYAKQEWWWLPLPLVLGTVLFEYAWMAFSDRAVHLEADDEGLTLTDHRLQRKVTMPWSSLDSVTLVHRSSFRQPTELVVALGRQGAPSLAFRVEGPVPPASLDVEPLDAVLGGLGGLLRSATPRGYAVRQPITDVDSGLLIALIARAPAGRRGFSVWRGLAPDRDWLGQLSGQPTAWVSIDEDALHLDGQAYPWTGLELGRAERVVSGALHTTPDANGEDLVLPLLVLRLGEGAVTLALPAPLLDADLPTLPLDEATLHTNPLGAVLLLDRLWASHSELLPAGLQRPADVQVGAGA